MMPVAITPATRPASVVALIGLSPSRRIPPVEFRLRIVPADPIDSNDPADPTDRIEPAEPIERIDPAEPIDAIDPAEPMDIIDPAEETESVDPTDQIERTLNNDMLQSRARINGRTRQRTAQGRRPPRDAAPPAE